MLGARGCLGAKFFYIAKIYVSHIAEENNTTPNSRQVLSSLCRYDKSRFVHSKAYGAATPF